MPPAPPMFSTITVRPRSSERRGARMRPMRSPPPPAANGTTIVTARVGQSCAMAALAPVSTATAMSVLMAGINALPIANSHPQRASDQEQVSSDEGGRSSVGIRRRTLLALVVRPTLAPADRSRQHARFAEGVPQRRRLLDETLSAAKGQRNRHRHSAARGNRREIVVQPQFGIAPIALVRLIADREIEAAKAAPNRMAEQLV